MKILVTDNSKEGLAILISTLEGLGHEVIGTTNGEEAIDFFMQARPDFVILDVMMQHMSGFECARRMRKIHIDDWIPIIFLSSSADNDSVSQGFAAGCDFYLPKPLNDIKLTAKIKAMQRIADMQKKLYEVTQKLSVLTSTDLLTGSDNRLQFDKKIREHISYAKRFRIKLALLILDLDHFKEINDHLGHHIGDLLLIEVAKRLKNCLRAYDSLARLGGDEFAIILNNISHPKDAGYLAQRILNVLKPAYHLDKHELHISCSIGISCYPMSGTNPEKLIQHADIAMYSAKEQGRNTFRHYTAGFQSNNERRFAIESALRFAMEKNELFMCYQPIFKLGESKLVGMEALMRWNNPKLGIIPPDIFIPIAEELGLINNMGDWALRHVCEQAAKWYNEGHTEFKLSVNISARQLLNTNFLKLIKLILQETKLPPKLLDFELTESTIMSDSSIIEKIITEISKMKIGISLDDFGTGYSSLTHLKRLPISTLKIDKSFVMDVRRDPNDALIVKSIIALAKTLKLNLIAEGIETDDQLQFIIKNKCLYGQGFYLSKPLETTQMSLLLQNEMTPQKRN